MESRILSEVKAELHKFSKHLWSLLLLETSFSHAGSLSAGARSGQHLPRPKRAEFIADFYFEILAGFSPRHLNFFR